MLPKFKQRSIKIGDCCLILSNDAKNQTKFSLFCLMSFDFREIWLNRGN